MSTGLKNDHSTGVALVGAGMVADTYASVFQELGPTVHLSGVLSRSASTSDAFLRRHKQFAGVSSYASISEVAADPQVDVVILATPPDARIEYVNVLAEARKAILLEKPVERSLDAASMICQLAETAGIPLGIVLQHRVKPSVRKLAALLEQQNPGKLFAVEISIPWWRDQSYYDEPGRGTYERDGGGVLITQAIHTLDLALQFSGPVQQVSALSATTGFHSMEAEDFVSASLQFHNGAVGNLIASTACYPGRQEEIRLYYEELSVHLKGTWLQVVWRDGKTEEYGEGSGSGSGADPMAFSSILHETIVREFCIAVNTGTPPPVSAQSALQVHALIDALERSSKNNGRAMLL